MNLSDKDFELLAQLSKNGKASQRELAVETGVAPTRAESSGMEIGVRT